MGLFNRKKKEKELKPDDSVMYYKPNKLVQWQHNPSKPSDTFTEETGTIIYHPYWYPDVMVRGAEHQDIDYKKLRHDKVNLVAEPTNQYDDKAIRVEQDGVLLGYIPANNLQKMLHDFPSKREMNNVVANLVKVDEEKQLLEIELDFYSIYFDTDPDYPKDLAKRRDYDDDDFDFDYYDEDEDW